MLLNDTDICEGLVGIPHYIHSMIAFASVFLLKVAAQHSGIYIEDTIVFDLTTKAVRQFRSTAVGKYHLVHLMADGLEKMVASQMKNSSMPGNYSTSDPSGESGVPYITQQSGSVPPSTNGTSIFVHDIEGNVYNGGSIDPIAPFLNFDSMMSDLDFASIGF